MKGYVLSLPERIIRSRTLRFVIEEVGGAEGVYAAEGALPNDFLARRTVGNVVEALASSHFTCRRCGCSQRCRTSAASDGR